ncbi:MAG: tRNA(Met) cytidine acetyltransferase TmcA, partial [Gemmatimonadota bacterium]
GCPDLPFRRAREALGGECDTLVFNALDGFDPDALGAAAGLPRAGGRFIWLVPPLDDWPDRPDPELDRLSSYPFTHREAGNAFLRRLVERLRRAPGVWHLAENAPLTAPPAADHSFAAIEPPDDPACLTPDQAEAVEQIRRVARGRPRRPLVLRSHRGRGKSSALGIAAARVLADELGDVVVTAPRRDNVDALFERATAQPGIDRNADGTLGSGGHHLRFLPPDVLLQRRPQARLLLVDEAAALPAPVLEALYRAWPRAVFATTQHGYEGTGRGFAVRFEPRLEQMAVSVRRQHLTTPIRWAAGDPLEAMIDRLLLLDAEPAPSGSIDATAATAIAPIAPRELIRDEARLAELFGLLVSAHYRTTPRDLRQLLDVPGTTVWTATAKGHVLATAVTQDEGGLDPALGEEVFAGERRVRGHLLPQTMAAHAGEPEWTGLCGRRIQRIAVHPAARRRGLGSRLVEAIAGQARDDGLDFVGASFGADPELIAFWEAQGMAFLHIGQQRDHVSGHRALVMARGLSTGGKAAVSDSARRFAHTLPTLAAGPLRTADPLLLAELLSAPPDARPALTADQWRQVEACARRRHHLDAALPALRTLLSTALGRAGIRAALPSGDRALLVARFLQMREPVELADVLGLGGRAAVERRSRHALGTVLAGLEADHPSSADVAGS